MSLKRIVVVGAGGFAREVHWLIREINQASPEYAFEGYAVSDLSRLGERDSQSEVRGDYSWLRAHRNEIDALALGVGTPAARLRIARELEADFPADRWPALVHPTVRLDRKSCEIGPGVLLCAGVIGTVNLRLQSFSMVNLACTLGHEAELGRGCVVNPTVNISGGAKIGDGVLIGTGAQILQSVRVGKGATIGAGAVVTQDVPDEVTVVGIPAKPMAKKG